MTFEKFKSSYLGEYTLPEPERKLHEKLIEYYWEADEADKLGTNGALVAWRRFSIWARDCGYTPEEVSKAKRFTSHWRQETP